MYALEGFMPAALEETQRTSPLATLSSQRTSTRVVKTRSGSSSAPPFLCQVEPSGRGILWWKNAPQTPSIPSSIAPAPGPFWEDPGAHLSEC